MRWRRTIRFLALAAALPLIALSALSAWRSLERLYTAYPITHGHSFSDDLGAGHIKVAFEIGVWCLVMGISAAAFLFLRLWQLRTNIMSGCAELPSIVRGCPTRGRHHITLPTSIEIFPSLAR